MKKGLTILLALVLVIGSSTFAFASALGEQPPIPVWLTAPAIGDGGSGGSGGGGGSGVGGVDFTINDKVPVTAVSGSSKLSISDIKVTNNANTGQLLIYKIEVKTVNGWALKPDKASYFEKLKADTKELSIVADGVHDFAEDSVYLLGESRPVPPRGEFNTVSFSGHIGTYTKAMNCIVANIIPTISIY